jgi:hypothetical protein
VIVGMKRLTLPWALVVIAGCGDPVLPSDYPGPAASAVSGNVIQGLMGAGRDAERPRMSLVWLVDQAFSPSLIGQPLSFRRSVKLQHDWDIGLFLPVEGAAQYEVPVDAGAGAGARIGVAKIVYFDDRNKTESLEWGCAGSSCDRVLAISDQFVLFVDRPSYCQEPGKGAQERVASGYHYYAFDVGTMTMRQLTASESMSFTVMDKAPAETLPTQSLVEFTNSIRRKWHTGLNGTCGE